MIKLRGMTWNHIRGYGPLLTTSEQFSQFHPDIQIEWDRRSLKDFGDYPVDRLTQEYDMVIIDHPHIGIATEKGTLVVLDERIPSHILQNLAQNSVGLSCHSYQWNGHQWALPVDAAGQVSVYRKDLMGNREIPRTWDQVFELADSLPVGQHIALPLCPTDSICTLLSVAANLSEDSFFDGESGLKQDVLEESLALIHNLIPKLHPKSLEWNPIQTFDHMAANHHDIAYVPLAFGYSNYSRPGYKENLLHFTDIPSRTGIPQGGLLGGTGLAISAYSKHIEEAVQYAVYVNSEDVQKTTYFQGGGQPGHRAAWLDPEVNDKSAQFFQNTIRTLDLSYLRPRFKHSPAFQEQAGDLLHEYFVSPNFEVTECAGALSRLYERVKRSNQ